MFCYQCQETVRNTGCTMRGVCGKTAEVADLQDLLLYTLMGISHVTERIKERNYSNPAVDEFILEALFTTITNVNFDIEKMLILIERALIVREGVVKDALDLGRNYGLSLPDAATWKSSSREETLQKAQKIGILSYGTEDIRSLKSLLLYGLKGMAAYAEHAAVLDFHNTDIYSYMKKGLSAIINPDISMDELISLVMECGSVGVTTMALLDQANTTRYGHPEPTKVNIGVRKNPGILISGHDLRDFEELLEQSKDQGVDIYTHSEMLPANSYPYFKKYSHLVGNYGSSWWHQQTDFEQFNGVILLTTNCLVPPKESYINRLFTTGVVQYPGVKHIPNREKGKTKDFSELIAMAKKCTPPTELETGYVMGGFAHNTLMSVADKVLDAVKSGKIKRFIVMAGCDGRFKERDYYSEVAKNLPHDAVILTAGCAKYRYNKLALGDIDGIPRVIDAGQCNDSYSLAYFALQVQKVLGLDDINQLPISYDIAWYEQKAVQVLLALLSLGVKGIRLGPTLPAFLSPNVAKFIIETFNLRPITNVQDDIANMMLGK